MLLIFGWLFRVEPVFTVGLLGLRRFLGFELLSLFSSSFLLFVGWVGWDVGVDGTGTLRGSLGCGCGFGSGLGSGVGVSAPPSLL